MDDAVSEFLRVLQEATRARPDTRRTVFVPPQGTELAQADYHHFVYGQRGSGKSTLLRKLQGDQIESQRAAVWVDQEVFSALSYPDVLVSSVAEVVDGVLSSAQDVFERRRTALPWYRRRSAMTVDEVDLVAGMATSLENLRQIKFAPVDSEIEWVTTTGARSAKELAGSINFRKVATASAKTGSETSSSVQSTQRIANSKSEYLERALPEFRGLLADASELSGGGFVFLDDLYLLNRDDQPRVLGYMHRLLKDTGLWLKVGSIRYLTTTHVPGAPPYGMQERHDAHVVALDNGMRAFNTSSAFLERIIRGLAGVAGVELDRIFNEGSLQRLALAAGCVPRDYLTLAGNAIGQARNRAPTTKSGMDRVTVEDVNQAAGEMAPAKFEDMQKDAPSKAAESRALIGLLTEFCRRTRTAYFLVDAADRELADRLQVLRHLRFVHLLHESETVPDRASQRFDVWLLDVSQLSAQRALQVDFTGWTQRENRRRRNLIYQPAVASQPTLDGLTEI